jgi:hypothetical protein
MWTPVSNNKADLLRVGAEVEAGVVLYSVPGAGVQLPAVVTVVRLYTGSSSGGQS